MAENNELVLKKLRHMIEAETFGDEGRLPPERILVEKLGITRSVLRKALSELESEGLIWRQVGKGTFVRTGPFSSPELSPNLSFKTNPVEIMEVMAVLQPKIAAMAALRASPQQIEMMSKYAFRCEQANDNHSRLKWDFLMHDTITRSTNNNILIVISDYLYKSKVWGRRKETVFTPERWKIYFKQHNLLINAIKEREPSRAFELMDEHIETVRRHLLEEL